MTWSEYQQSRNDNMGICRACGYEQSGCEPDARGYECEQCGQKAVYGTEELLMMGKLEVDPPLDNPHDETEGFRREMIAEQQANIKFRKILEADHGQVWDTDQLREEFEVIGFMAPFVAVKRISDGVKGSMMFQHSPRFYYNWVGGDY